MTVIGGERIACKGILEVQEGMEIDDEVVVPKMRVEETEIGEMTSSGDVTVGNLTAGNVVATGTISGTINGDVAGTEIVGTRYLAKMEVTSPTATGEWTGFGDFMTDGYGDFGGDLNVGGKASADRIETTGDASVGGDMSVSGTVTAGTATVNGDLSVNGNISAGNMPAPAVKPFIRYYFDYYVDGWEERINIDKGRIYFEDDPMNNVYLVGWTSSQNGDVGTVVDGYKFKSSVTGRLKVTVTMNYRHAASDGNMVDFIVINLTNGGVVSGFKRYRQLADSNYQYFDIHHSAIFYAGENSEYMFKLRPRYDTDATTWYRTDGGYGIYIEKVD